VTYDSSTAIIDHVGQRSDFSQAYNDSQIEHAAGFVSGIRAHDQASILLTGGVLDGFDFVELLGSSSLQLQAGSTAGIRAQESSTVWMSGGLVFEFLSVRDDATAFISGGTTDASLSVSGNGVLTINGGDVFSQGLSVNGGIVRIVGSDFMVNGQPVGLGTVSVDFGGLEATLADGSYFASVFSRTNGGTIVLVPEPSTGLLLAGGLALLGRRRRAV
jgi:hypothetical protein